MVSLHILMMTLMHIHCVYLYTFQWPLLIVVKCSRVVSSDCEVTYEALGVGSQRIQM